MKRNEEFSPSDPNGQRIVLATGVANAIRRGTRRQWAYLLVVGLIVLAVAIALVLTLVSNGPT